MKTIFASLFFATFYMSVHFAACSTPQNAMGDCIDKSKINNETMCAADYDPVCGCDGKTYSNACEASKKGVTKWTKGACAK